MSSDPQGVTGLRQGLRNPRKDSARDGGLRGFGTPLKGASVTPTPSPVPQSVTPPPKSEVSECPLPAFPACKSTEDHQQDARGVWHCGRCRWLFSVRDGRPVNVLEFRTRRTRR